MYQERPLGNLIMDAATEPYWNAAKQGVLRIKRCTACSKVHFYPRALCPYCLSDTEWIDASGLGTIYSVTVTRKAGPIAYALAYVTLDEGVSMLTNIVDCDLDTLRIGDREKLCFKPADGENRVPMFTPVG
jgi:uncharacterized OB-fold protein